MRGESPVMLSSGPVAMLANGTVVLRLATRTGLLTGSVLRAICLSRRLITSLGIWRLAARRFTFDLPRRVREVLEPPVRAAFVGLGLAR
jgi:hypothetical protein